jgi:DNA-nicking Smr family endonuclease
MHTANNTGRAPDEVDLHGLHVSEAISRADGAIRQARARGAPRLVFIVGKGLHSEGGVARLRPAIERQLVTKHSLRVTPGVPNEVRERA